MAPLEGGFDAMNSVAAVSRRRVRWKREASCGGLMKQ
jgi:hypothetical protein